MQAMRCGVCDSVRAFAGEDMKRSTTEDYQLAADISAARGVKPETVDHPAHYNASPSGVEAIDVIEHLSFNVGNAMKYLWRAEHKGANLDDLRKAAWYVQREILRLEKQE